MSDDYSIIFEHLIQILFLDLGTSLADTVTDFVQVKCHEIQQKSQA